MNHFPPTENQLKNMRERERCTETFSWAIPSDEAILKIREFVGEETILEIGAGLGYWAKLLQRKGVKLIPTDNKGASWKHNANPSFIDIICKNHTEAIESFPNATVLFLCWPPYANPMATESLKLFRGDKLIYIGETLGGCNATDDFFSALETQWEEINDISIEQWYGIHDRLFLYERKESDG